ncbi:hypothetical protein B296_00012569 [Ensete ventricosum]|uniref:Uncharacterized protein n=1 Tax=Ensete ventricosum TaxID=4639 RepID=A0A426Y5H8_ENSVE|nr:hypothetical protein B296_00012569 [Ensete ventricosum]
MKKALKNLTASHEQTDSSTGPTRGDREVLEPSILWTSLRILRPPPTHLGFGGEQSEMGLLEHEFVRKYVLSTFLLLGLLVGSAAGNVVLIGRNVSLSFPDVEANFGECVVFLFYRCVALGYGGFHGNFE